jgi:tetratricopeptide (TPR) repeat protein
MKKIMGGIFLIGFVFAVGVLGLSAAAAKAENQSAGGFVLPEGWQPRMKINEAAPDKELGLAKEALIRRKVFNLLRKKKFDELQSLLLGLQAEMEKDISRETPLVDAFEGFEIPDSAAYSLFTDWLKEYPDQWPALAARGVFFTHLGFEARGKNWGIITPREKIDGMKWFFELAKPDLEKAIELKPSCVPALRSLIAVESALGDALGAIAQYGDKNPESYRLRAQAIHFLCPRWGGSYEAMAAYIGESQRFTNANPRLLNLDGYGLFDKADTLLRIKKYEEALGLIREAISMSGNWLYPVLEGRILLAMKNPGQALASFDEAVKGRLNGETISWRATALMELERYEEALADLDRARQIDPFNERALSGVARGAQELIQKGRAAMESGDFKRAETYLKIAPKFSPGSAQVHFLMAHTLVKQNRLVDAERAARRAVGLDPRKFDYTLLLDWLLAQRKDWEGIVGAWNEFLRLEPRNGKAYMERAGARRRNRQPAEAIADLKKACELGVAEACALVR